MNEKNSLRRYYDALPPNLKKVVKSLLESVPFTKRNKQKKWVKNTYVKFGVDQRKFMFLSMARFIL